MAFVIYTDSGCDLSAELLRKWDVRYESLTFQFDRDEHRNRNEDMDVKEFYARMRAGGVSHTSAVDVGTFLEGFERELQAENDILYIGFDAALSTTCSSAMAAAEELRSKYPERKIITLDTLCASGGQAMLVWYAVELRDVDTPMEEIAEQLKQHAPRIATWFTVSDLSYLKRGGYVSAASCLAASVLDIKPLLHVDDAGKLEPVQKVQGRKRAIRAMLDTYLADSVMPGGQFVVCHCDAETEANAIADELRKNYGAIGIVTCIGPVIGSHAGPGTLVLSYEAKKR